MEMNKERSDNYLYHHHFYIELNIEKVKFLVIIVFS